MNKHVTLPIPLAYTLDYIHILMPTRQPDWAHSTTRAYGLASITKHNPTECGQLSAHADLQASPNTIQINPPNNMSNRNNNYAVLCISPNLVLPISAYPLPE